MTRHLLKLVWNRKKTNALVMLEIFISFVVVFAVFAAMAVFANNYRRPLGFTYQDILTIAVDLPPGPPAENAKRYETILGVTRSYPGVESAAGVIFEPYFEGRNTGMWELDGQRVEFDRNYVTDDFARVMGLRLVAGRWFSREDEGAPYRPVVLDRDFAIALYGTEDVLGREFDPGQNPPMKVVGVIDDYRSQGEFSPRGNYVFIRANLGLEPLRIVARTYPGAQNARLENGVLRRLEQAVPGGSFTARPLAQQRDFALRLWATPVVVGGLVGAFLILMVALGLTGVMWQNVTQRTRELGLRRALGAERGRIRRQIVTEIVLIASLGLLFGVMVVVQVPLMGLISVVEGSVFAIALVAALGLIYSLAIVCGLYPSWLASRVEPAEALHYE